MYFFLSKLCTSILHYTKFIGIESPSDEIYEYRQQLNSKLTQITPIAAVLGVAENTKVKTGSIKSFNIPDGAIISNNLSLLIENKIGYNSYLLKEQLEGHKNVFPEGQVVQEEPIITSWKAIRSFFQGKLQYFEGEKDTLTCFLLRQFEQFCVINCIGDRQKSKEYFFLRFEKDQARKIARQIDNYIWSNPEFEVEDAGTTDGIGYKKKGFLKFATLTTARQRCLILHVGRKEEYLGLDMQSRIDVLLHNAYDRNDSDLQRYPHEAYIRLEWVDDFEKIKPFIEEAYSHRV